MISEYIICVYYTIITMTTIGFIIILLIFQSFIFIIIKKGYGDISPSTKIEMIYIIILAIFASGVFGYVIS